MAEHHEGSRCSPEKNKKYKRITKNNISACVNLQNRAQTIYISSGKWTDTTRAELFVKKTENDHKHPYKSTTEWKMKIKICLLDWSSQI